MTGESDRQMTSVCFGSEESKEYDENIRKERKGTLDVKRRTGNIECGLAVFQMKGFDPTPISQASDYTG
jgi:hypothetical protein